MSVISDFIGNWGGIHGKNKTRTIQGHVTEAREHEEGNNRGHDSSGMEQRGSGISSGGILCIEYSLTNPLSFRSAITKAKESHPYGAYVHAYEVNEYIHKTLLLAPNGYAGVAVTEDGDIVSVFRNIKAPKGAMHNIILNALGHGGTRLDCFDGFLPRAYAQYGFVPVAKLKFNREYAPEGWNYERDGEPDIIFMAHNGDSTVRVSRNFGNYPPLNLAKVPYVEDYTTGINLQLKHVISTINSIIY